MKTTKTNNDSQNKNKEEDEMSIFGRREKNMYITVQNGEVVVSAPWYFTANKIQQIVQCKKNWILNQIEENIPNMQSVKIFGKNYDIEVSYKNIKTPELNLEKNYKIEIILPNKYKKVGNEQILKMSIEKMYEQIANNEIENLMEKTRKLLGIAPEEYNVLKMKDTLGKCVNGKITINPILMQFKREIIEYVIMHEFCHLKYKTHGKRFYEIIEKYMPDYRKYEREVQEYEF